VRLLYAAGADAFNQDATLDTPYPCPLAGASCGGKCIDTDANRVCGRVAALNPPDWFVPALDLRDDCSNGLDDDGDGNADHPADLGCDAPDDQSEWSNAILCDNGQSDDEDPFVDYPADPGCDSIADPTETSPALVCDDGADNDGDGRYDFSADLGCDSVFDGSELSSTLICDDGLDNDGDGAADHPADLGCFDQADPSERTGYACDDGLDNDGDGYADWPLDPGCFSIYDVDEWAAYGTIECDDAFDNDADGLIDLADPGCISPFDTSEQSETTSVPAGQGVQASLLGGASAVYGIALEFENTPGGDLTVESYVVPAGGTLPGLPPVDFQLGTDPAQYWQLEYTGAFNGGGIELTFHYDDTGLTLAEEEQLRIYHYVGGTWVPHYDLPDTVNDTITVTVTSFSPFVVAYVPQCADTRDNDGDGLADWPADPGCTDGDDPLEIAQSATIHVTTTADELATNGNCSLREAIRAANLDLAVDACEAGGVADSILLPEGTYPLSLAGAGEDDGLTGDLDVRAALALVGQGAGAVIDASGLGDRVLHVRPSGADVDAVLLNLTLRGGDAGGSDGGGLLVESAGGFHPTTTVEDCAIESNTAASGGGVRIAHPLGGTATLSRTAIRTNTATGTGAGGLDAEGPSVSLLDSAVEGNTAVSGAGGIADRQWLLVRHSTIAGNQSASGPGGIGVSQAYLSLGNATVSGNTTGGAGGGLAAGDASSWAAVDVLFTTIAGNAAAQGGGLQVGAAAQTTFALGASVIAGNTAAADPDVGGAVASGGDNVVGQQGASTGWVASDQVGTVGAPLDAKLGPLATNGGPTRTHALLAASPALDGADCQGVIRDQRNVPRPYGAACDAGALESTPACSDTLDNDGDGLVDEAADPGCFSAASLLENPKCDNDLDDDGDGKVDWNGPGTPDPNCTQPYKDKESGSCGFGAELAFVMPLLAAWARRLRRRSTATGR
jgi:CSLREA domain-containing protein